MRPKPNDFGSGMPRSTSRSVASMSADFTTFAGIASSQVCESTFVTHSSRSRIPARSGTAARIVSRLPPSLQIATISRSPGPPWLTKTSLRVSTKAVVSITGRRTKWRPWGWMRPRW